MKKFRLYWDKDKEEVWLNALAKEGWALESFFLGHYRFAPCQRGEYVYRIDLLEHITSTKPALEYIRFVEETGAEYLCGWGRWAFFRKKTSEGPFELYTDTPSQIEQYKKIRLMMGICASVELWFSYVLLTTILNDHASFSTYFFAALLFLFALLIGNAALSAHKKINALKKSLKG